ncbi:MAG: hypothetical protein K1X89_20195 [Myxococcaceae bacterium]|nr:hypothetical protein [Myxococcaceae bacterium]
MPHRRLALPLVVTLVAGCVIAPLDATGKRCSDSDPCPAPLVCGADLRCGAASPGGGTGGNGGSGGSGGQGGSGGGLSGPPAVFQRLTFTTTSGDQTVPHALGTTPAALLLWTVALPADGKQDTSIFGLGLSDGVHSRALANLDTDSGGKTRAFSELDDAALVWLAADGSVAGRATLLRWDASGFVLRWTTAPAAAVQVHAVVLGGASVRAEVSEWTTPAAPGNAGVSGLPFAPQAVLSLVTFVGPSTALGTRVAGSGFGLGVVEPRSQFAVAVARVDSDNSNYGSAHFQRADRGLLGLSAANQDFVVTLEGTGTLKPDGVQYQATTATDGARRAVSLSLSMPFAQASRLLKTTAASPAEQDLPLGATPGLILAMSVNEAPLTKPTYDSLFSFGAGTGPSEVSAIGLRSQVGTPYTSRTQRSALFSVFTRTNAVSAEAQWTTTSDAGVTLTWAPNESRAVEVFTLALGATAAK